MLTRRRPFASWLWVVTLVLAGGLAGVLAPGAGRTAKPGPPPGAPPTPPCPQCWKYETMGAVRLQSASGKESYSGV